MEETKNKCNQCGAEENLLDAKDDEGNRVLVCESCYNVSCEGYELV